MGPCDGRHGAGVLITGDGGGHTGNQDGGNTGADDAARVTGGISYSGCEWHGLS
jgi:hypothetical protein